MAKPDPNIRVRIIAKCESARQAADHLGLSSEDTVRKWLLRDLQRLQACVDEAKAVIERQQRRVFRESTTADVARLRKLEARCVSPWVISFAARWGIL